MNDPYDLQRFADMHRIDYGTALSEIKSGKKESHWMWYIFPQVRGLGMSPPSWEYGIVSLEEAAAFLADPYLGSNLREICEALMQLETNNAAEVFGSIDKKKLRSSMTLFVCVAGEDSVFQRVLDKFFGGKGDNQTKRILNLT